MAAYHLANFEKADATFCGLSTRWRRSGVERSAMVVEHREEANCEKCLRLSDPDRPPPNPPCIHCRERPAKTLSVRFSVPKLDVRERLGFCSQSCAAAFALSWFGVDVRRRALLLKIGGPR